MKAGNNRIKVYTKNIDVLTIENITRGIFPDRKCFVCKSRITLDPYGNILPCSFFDNYWFGNIRARNFKQIWNNSKHRNFLKLSDRKKLAMCDHCIVKVARNSSFLDSVKKGYFAFTGKGYDQD
jgi:radical SAM protein with 4Fe4S-binding SPASM domain